MRRGQVWCRWAIIIAFPLSFWVPAPGNPAGRGAAAPGSQRGHANRQMLAVNQEMMRPVAEAVQTIGAAASARPFARFQFEPERAAHLRKQSAPGANFDAASRDSCPFFAMNTTFGIGGLVDLASLEGIPQQTGDFGQTLFVWGVSEGPYVVRPYLGSHPQLRDAVGQTLSIALAIRSAFGLFGTNLSWPSRLPRQA